MLANKTDKRQENLHLSRRLHVFVFIVAVAIMVSRRPDAIFNAQFWAEDGRSWYADAYNLGAINSLFLPYSGYLQIFPRLVAGFAQLFPLAVSPLIFNLVAIIIQILPANFIVSSRFSALLPRISTRLFLAFVYLARPNSAEIHANITGSQWYLALLACMAILAAPSQRLVWRFFDLAVVLMSALTGPFSILLAPITAIRWRLHRYRWLLILLFLLSASALIQLGTVIHAPPMPAAPLGATPKLFARILGGQVFLSTFFGQKGYSGIISLSLWNSPVIILTSSICLLAFIYALVKAPLELRLFIVFAALIFGFNLVLPAATDKVPQWQVLQLPGICSRYWFIPMLAFVATLVWMRHQQRYENLQLTASLALAVMLIGIALDWQHPAFVDLKFRDYANKFIETPVGTQVSIPINPPGWNMELVKH